MNIAYFQILLQKAMDDATSTVNYLLLSKAVQALNVGQIRTVATFANLPSAASNEGLLVWVTADEVLYFSNGAGWYSIATLGKGLAYGWGANECGQLGDNSITSTSSPVSVVGGFSDWCQIGAGYRHSVGLRSNGTLWSWGQGTTGKLGDNTTVTKSSPVSVVGGFTDWCQVSVGYDHTLAVRRNGTAWGWGRGQYGTLGNNSSSAQSSPVSVVGGFTDWCQVSAGYSHSLGVRSNGTAWGWGKNFYGGLGNNTTVDNISSPVSVVGGFTDWCQVAAGCNHSLGLRTNGSLWAWGINTAGQLGDNTTVSKSSPVSVVGGFADWCQITASITSHGVRRNGTLWSWGSNFQGQLGDNTTSNSSSPVSVVGGFTDWCQVSSTGRSTFALAVRTNGTAWGWGRNDCGQLGDNTTVNKSSPVSIVGGFTDWCRVSTGGYRHSVALRINNFI